AVWQALYFAVAAGLAFLGLLPFAEPLVALGGHAASLQALEVSYFRCLCFAALPTLVLAASNSFFAGRGDSWKVLYIDAAGQSVCVMVGQRLGENKPALAERSTWTGLWIATAYMVLIGLAFVLLPDTLTQLFRSDEDPARWSAIRAVVPGILRFIAVYSLFDS